VHRCRGEPAPRRDLRRAIREVHVEVDRVLEGAEHRPRKEAGEHGRRPAWQKPRLSLDQPQKQRDLRHFLDHGRGHRDRQKPKAALPAEHRVERPEDSERPGCKRDERDGHPARRRGRRREPSFEEHAVAFGRREVRVVPCERGLVAHRRLEVGRRAAGLGVLWFGRPHGFVAERIARADVDRRSPQMRFGPDARIAARLVAGMLSVHFASDGP
jgi:hypothetical protein